VKTCRICKEKFIPSRPLQPTCGFECHLKYADKVIAKSKAKLAKEDRRQDRDRKEKLKTRSDYLKEAQYAFNTYIKARDKAAGYACISSGRPLDWSGNAVDAGHWRSTGAAKHLRFNEDNCHAQSKHDNRYLAGNAVAYRAGLIARIGISRVEALENDNTSKKWSIEELKCIKNKYRAMTQALQKKTD